MKIVPKVVISGAIVLASAGVTLNILAKADAAHTVEFNRITKANQAFPDNERGDVLSNAGLPQIKPFALRERWAFGYMLNEWYPKIKSASLTHNVPFVFPEFVQPAKDKTHMVILSKMCLEPGKVPEALYMNKVYEKGSVTDEDILKLHTSADYPFPKSHQGLVSATYYYGFPGTSNASVLELQGAPATENTPFLEVTKLDAPVVEAFCADPQRNAAVSATFEKELLEYVGKALRKPAAAAYEDFHGVAVSDVDRSPAGIGINFKVDGVKGSQEAYVKLARMLASRGISVNAKAHTMLSSDSNDMLWNTYFSGYAIGFTKALVLNGGYDTEAKVYGLQLVLQQVSPQQLQR